MTSALGLPVFVTKEIRALWPVWLGSMVLVGAGVLVAGPHDHVRPLTVVTYCLGSVALGALSIGHEYTHRTLPLLLSQPFSRRRVLLVKVGVLAVMLATLSIVAWPVLFNPSQDFYRLEQWPGSVVLGLSMLGGLCLAPRLTMLCRNPLPGVVFTLAIPAAVWFVDAVLASVEFGLDYVGGESFELAVLWHSMLMLCVVAGVSGWGAFMRLEAIEGHSDMHLPQWLRRRATPAAVAPSAAQARPRSAVWLMAKKELRLQQMTFAATGLYLLCWVVLGLLRHFAPAPTLIELLPTGLTACFGGLSALLIGAVASAGERQLGTLEWQVLLPMATWKQWALKVGMALGLMGMLAIGLPALLEYLHPSPDRFPFYDWYQMQGWTVTLIEVTIGGLFVSSLCSNGLKALLVSAAVPLGLGVFGGSVPLQFRLWQVTWPLFDALRHIIPAWHAPAGFAVLRALLLWLWPVLRTGCLILVLGFALSNHRSAERGARRVWRQVAWVAGYLLAWGILDASGWAFLSRGLSR